MPDLPFIYRDEFERTLRALAAAFIAAAAMSLGA